MEFDMPTAPAEVISLKVGKRPVTREGLGVDVEARTVSDVILIETGEAQGHGFFVEPSFLKDLVTFVRKEMGGRVQCNMGHRWDANFFQLGRFDQVTLSEDGTRVTGKLSIYESADKSPVLKDMAQWFLGLADEDPQAVMCSIKFQAAGFYQYDEKNRKVMLATTWWGEPIKAFDDKPAYVEFGRLFSCDIVDEGALTTSLFSAGSSNAVRTFAEIVSAPGFAKFLAEHDDHFPQLDDYYRKKHGFSLGKFFTQMFKPSQEMAHDHDAPPVDQPIEAGAPAAGDQPAAPVAEPETPVTPVAEPEALSALQAQLDQLQEQLAARDARIAELEKQPAAAPTGLASEDAPTTAGHSDKPWLDSPINQKARAMRAVKA